MFTWRFKKKDYWEALRAPTRIQGVEELMALHEPWATSNASEVLRVIQAYGGQTSLDDEGLILVEIDDGKLEQMNAELARLGCAVSNKLSHTV